jgi:hypothetical protein
VYPNPAAREVVISVGGQRSAVSGRRSAVGGQVTLKIFDLYGREIMTMMDETKSTGEYSVKMDVSDLPAGVYLVWVQAGGQSAVKKLVVK